MYEHRCRWTRRNLSGRDRPVTILHYGFRTRARRRTPPPHYDDDDNDACNVTKTERVCRERISLVVQRIREKFPNNKRQSDLSLPSPKTRLTNFNVIIFRLVVNDGFLKTSNLPRLLYYNLKNLNHVGVKKRILVMLLQLRKEKK